MTVGGRARKAPPVLRVLTVPAGGEQPHSETSALLTAGTELPTEPAPWLDANGFVDKGHDLTAASFRAVCRVQDLCGSPHDRLQLVVQYGTEAAEVTPFTHRYRWGSAGHLQSLVASGLRLAPQWSEERGLCLLRSAPEAFAEGPPHPEGEQLTVPLGLVPGFAPVSAQWSLERASCPVPLNLTHSAGGGSELRIGPVVGAPDPGSWAIALTGDDGTRRHVHWSAADWEPVPFAGCTLERGTGGLVRLTRAPRRCPAADVTLSDAHLAITLAATAPDSVSHLLLRGARTELRGERAEASRFSIPLAHRAWRAEIDAPPSGGYRAWAVLEDGDEVPVVLTGPLSARTPLPLQGPAAVRAEHAPDGQLYFDFAAPLGLDERGRSSRRSLASAWTGPGKPSPADGVFLESWYGKTVSDNPPALLEALQAEGVPGPYYVTVADRSVEYPAQAEPVIAGSRAYWQALGASRLVVFNTWLPSGFRRHKDQYIVQTWHGTPLKALGADVPHRRGKPEAVERLRKGSREWDLLLSQNPYSTEILRRAYAFEGEVAETGYPRNDRLGGSGKDALRARARADLGLSPEAVVVLYAPTFRPEAKGSLGPLDTAGLMARLPEDAVLLARGHSVTLRRGKDLRSDRVVDVTSYPEPADLMAAADCLVTDYSSIMFDFAVTGRPILYFTPDYEDYLETGRGGYFDLAAEAPGPLLRTETALAKALTETLYGGWTPSEAYRRWQREFVPHDDGEAARRLAARISAALR
ncbi:CDP-glycerol glycerophosphotransferase family protein [Brevibacterium album]|uniref:CDP-glycerol glycerophosphotransferase family protein n=1 Tax=Brevibacterium album TaxID=417948 RepID=UPI0012EB9820|nr:CDP-glycerol glycerophosphotransferase family protein [Brevibacterium album]